MTRKSAASKLATLMTIEAAAQMTRHEYLMAYAYLRQHAYNRQEIRREMRGFKVYRSGSRYAITLQGTHYQGKSTATVAYDTLRRTEANFLFTEADEIRHELYRATGEPAA